MDRELFPETELGPALLCLLAFPLEAEFELAWEVEPKDFLSLWFSMAFSSSSTWIRVWIFDNYRYFNRQTLFLNYSERGPLSGLLYSVLGYWLGLHPTKEWCCKVNLSLVTLPNEHSWSQNWNCSLSNKYQKAES